MTKQHFEWFAEYVKNAPVSEAEKHMLATMVMAAAREFNGKFRADLFLKAAGLEPKS